MEWLSFKCDRPCHIFMWCRNSPAALTTKPHLSQTWRDYRQASVFAEHTVASFMISHSKTHLGDPFHRIIILTNPLKFSQIVRTFDRQISPRCFNFQTQWAEIRNLRSSAAEISVKLFGSNGCCPASTIVNQEDKKGTLIRLVKENLFCWARPQ